MAVNTAFHTNNLHSLATERSLYQNLLKEAIQIYGHDVYYVNRTTVALDNVLGEDALSKFTTQHPIEMYVENAEGFGGDKEIINQFGLENRNEITFVVSKERFQEMDSQITLEDGTDTTGGSILLDGESKQTYNITIEEGTIPFTSIGSIVLEDNSGEVLLDGVHNEQVQHANSKLLLNRYRENNPNSSYLVIEAGNTGDENNRVSTEEFGNLLILNGTDSDGTDAMGSLLFPDETGNGNMVYDQSASGIDVGSDIIHESGIDFSKNNVTITGLTLHVGLHTYPSSHGDDVIALQDHKTKNQFRNIWIRKL